MALPLSGFPDETELIKIDHRDFSLILKGKPYHERYIGLKQYQKMDHRDVMQFAVQGEGILSAEVFDIDNMRLSSENQVRPIFFENGSYTLMIFPKEGKEISFYHEHPLLRKVIKKTEMPEVTFLSGNLNFQSEVGLTSFEIRLDGQTLVTVTMEIFPTKLDYQKDYRRLLDEVNEEIYNLAFHFIKKTYLQAGIKLDGTPSQTEFYQLIRKHYNQFIQAIQRIEQMPHHTLVQEYHRVRGDQLGKMDSTTRRYLQKRSNLWVDVKDGIPIHGRNLMPTSGIKGKKEIVYDTNENRYVKWMMGRLVDKLEDLIQSIEQQMKKWNKTEEIDVELISRVRQMIREIEQRKKNVFWRTISNRRSTLSSSLVLQMAPGYRDAFQLYLTISKGLILRNSTYQMSVKDVATLYEYWTFLKLGQILARKYEQLDQTIVKVDRSGLFVNLDKTKSATRIFQHPVTHERIELVYQKYPGKLPTLSQRPDTMLSIQKKGKAYDYNYVFDAKYRIDYALPDSYYQRNYQTAGPMEDDINTMHRYRDAIVSSLNGPYERTAFGAYVLFPWNNEDEYRSHHFYESIGRVNIGGLPFLPNATEMVEQFVDRLIEKSPEELQKEGILPIGTKEEWESSLMVKVLVGLVSSQEMHKDYIRTKRYKTPISALKKGWQEVKYIALYVKAGIAEWNGIKEYGAIESVEVENEHVIFSVHIWQNLKSVIVPVQYGISNTMITSLTQLLEAKELPELYMKSKEEMILRKMLRRVSDNVHIRLDSKELDEATTIQEYNFKDIKIELDREHDLVIFTKGVMSKQFSFEKLFVQPTAVFRDLLTML
nr:restriction endonuclease-like protein [Bacillus sp. FJAT-27916]